MAPVYDSSPQLFEYLWALTEISKQKSSKNTTVPKKNVLYNTLLRYRWRSHSCRTNSADTKHFFRFNVTAPALEKTQRRTVL